MTTTELIVNVIKILAISVIAMKIITKVYYIHENTERTASAMEYIVEYLRRNDPSKTINEIEDELNAIRDEIANSR